MLNLFCFFLCSLVSLPGSYLARLACDPSGSRVIDCLLNAKITSVPMEKKQKFIDALKGHYHQVINAKECWVVFVIVSVVAAAVVVDCLLYFCNPHSLCLLLLRSLVTSLARLLWKSVSSMLKSPERYCSFRFVCFVLFQK